MKILLHICCGPCAIYALDELRKNGNVVEGFFYNPNIHPVSEYIKRKEAAMKMSESTGLKVDFYRDMSFEDYFKKVTYYDQPDRCPLCWELRLNVAADYALRNGFDGFTTTLLISPYQDHEKVKAIASLAADKYRIPFVYQDFRPGFGKSHDLSRQMGLYHQKYCGCLFSERERYESSL